MKQLNFENANYSLTEKFFVERSIELLYRGTIDSYRVQVMNSYTILIELLFVLRGYKKGKVKSFLTVSSCLEEAIQLIKQDEEDKLLTFISFDREFYINLLRQSSKDEKKFFSEYYNNLKSSTQLLVNNSSNYLNLITEKLKDYLVEDSISEINDQEIAEPSIRNYKYYEPINRLTGFLLSGLLSRGYSKGFLFKYFSKVLVYNESTFNDSYNEIVQLIYHQPKEYRIWFKARKEVIKNMKSFNNCAIHDDILLDKMEESRVSNELRAFKKDTRRYGFIEVTSNALDYFSALSKAQYSLAENLDIINLGFGKSRLDIQDRALVQDGSNPTAGEFHSIHYILDGSYGMGIAAFQNILEKIPIILTSSTITEDSKEKIKSAIRYLRMGNEALEIEHSFINYWVGLEYLFSNYKESSFTRTKTYLSITQSIIYTKRNLKEYLKNCESFLSTTNCSTFDTNNIHCLEDEEAYKEIIRTSQTQHPLLTYRSWSYKNKILKNDERKKYIENHRKRLEQHLVRLYRIRNEIIHEAKFNFVSENLTSNLKYYLMTTLSLIVNDFKNYIDSNHSTKYSIDDFFILQKIKFDYWKHRNYPLDLLLKSEERFNIHT